MLGAEAFDPVVLDQNLELAVLSPKTFEAMIKGNAEIAVRMIMKLAQRLREADEQIENLLLKDNNSRIVHTLTRLADSQGQQTDQGVRIAISMEALASKTGVDAPQVQEIINKLVQAKIATADAEGLLIPDVNKMRKYLEFLEMKEQFGDM